ncbi:MAG: NAD-dependent epimerase/dehydratase family protein, partial [Armatimonadetes bacterium]|nr:NAD-dependent epimerase/dehydratase family protein [Armatimonadota bacterium]
MVTGGAGFIGSALIWQLNRDGNDDILVVDQLGSGEKWRNLAGLRFHSYLHKDEFIRRIRLQDAAFDGVRQVAHLGARSATTELDADYLL